MTGTVRMSLKRPDAGYRWKGAAPYCAGNTASNDTHYTFPSAGNYLYTPEGAGVPSVAQAQATCVYMDAKYAVPSDMEVGAIFMPTRITVSREEVAPMPQCADLGADACTFATVSSNLTYVADPSMFTLMIDHAFTSTVGLSYNVRSMQGKLIDNDGHEVDPCAVYAGNPAGCPAIIQSGVTSGSPYVFSLQSLLDAAGVESLDQAAAASGTLASQTYRYAGLILVVDIQYTNFYLAGGGIVIGSATLNPDTVAFAYKVKVVANQDFKTEQVMTPSIDRYDSSRNNYNQHGIRILVTQSGRVGVFNFQALLINLTVSLGLLSVALVITDFVAFSCCPARSVYAQYRMRRTVDMSDVRASGKWREVIKQFKSEKDLVDPVPEVFRTLFEAHEREIAERNRLSNKAPASTATVAPAPASATAPLAVAVAPGVPVADMLSQAANPISAPVDHSSV